jgi:hypothetical protein
MRSGKNITPNWQTTASKSHREGSCWASALRQMTFGASALAAATSSMSGLRSVATISASGSR